MLTPFGAKHCRLPFEVVLDLGLAGGSVGQVLPVPEVELAVPAEEPDWPEELPFLGVPCP